MRWLDGIVWKSLISGHEQSVGVGDGQRGLACCGPWDGKESDTTEGLSRTESIYTIFSDSKKADLQYILK